jgi:low affinity Fe/Cu permease
LSDLTATSPMDPVVRFVVVGFGLGCVGSFVPKFLLYVCDLMHISDAWLVKNATAVAASLIVICFIIGGIIGLKLAPQKGAQQDDAPE